MQNDRQKGQERSQILKEEHELMLARQKSEGTSLELQQLDFMYNVPEELYNAPVYVIYIHSSNINMSDNPPAQSQMHRNKRCLVIGMLMFNASLVVKWDI